MAPSKYPLLQIIDVKQKRVEDQEKVVKEKIQQLEKEQEKLREREAERDKVVKHHTEKLSQLRQELDTGTTSDKVQQMKAYLKVVKEKVEVEEKKVVEQQGHVAQAEKNLELARQELHIRRQDVDKLLNHKKDWEKEQRKEAEIIEGREQDELGSVIFMNHKKNRIS